MFNNRPIQNASQKDPFVQKILAGVPLQIAATFTNTQLTELKKVFIDRVGKPSPVDMRLSIPFFKRRFYLVFLIGKETRSQQRLKNSKFQVLDGFSCLIFSLALISVFLSNIYIIEKELNISLFPFTQIQKVLAALKDHPEI